MCARAHAQSGTLPRGLPWSVAEPGLRTRRGAVPPEGAWPVAAVTGRSRPSRLDAGAAGAIFAGCGRGHRSVPEPRRECGRTPWTTGPGRGLRVPTGRSSRGPARRLMARGGSWGRGAVCEEKGGVSGHRGPRGPLRPKRQWHLGSPNIGFGPGPLSPAMPVPRSQRNSEFLCLYFSFWKE